jgi:acyl-coenzyme A thioesterase PaaI-like protein
MTETAPDALEVRGGFPDVKPVGDAPPELGPFVAAMRRLQDLTMSTNPDPALWAAAAAHVDNACALLDGHQVPETETVAGHFTRSHVGGNNAVHGGMIPLFYDWLFGMVVSTAGIHPTRTAYLHVDYRKITPIDEPLIARGHISDTDGRKVFISSTMSAADGSLLSEANGLMVRLLPHQP